MAVVKVIRLRLHDFGLSRVYCVPALGLKRDFINCNFLKCPDESDMLENPFKASELHFRKLAFRK